MEYLYVCRFSNGHIKVGRSIEPQSRIASHVERVSCMGVSLADHRTFPVIGPADLAESALIDLCAAVAEKRNKSEWFIGVDYAVACEWAAECATRIYAAAQASKFRTYFLSLDRSDRIIFALDVGTSVGHLNNCAYGYTTPNAALCVRIEQCSTGAVTRPDLRDDWRAIWPELVKKQTLKASEQAN